MSVIKATNFLKTANLLIQLNYLCPFVPFICTTTVCSMRVIFLKTKQQVKVNTIRLQLSKLPSYCCHLSHVEKLLLVSTHFSCS